VIGLLTLSNEQAAILKVLLGQLALNAVHPFAVYIQPTLRDQGTNPFRWGCHRLFP